MRKFTLIAMLMVIFASMAKAEVVDKYFFKIPTDKQDAGWVLQDAGNAAVTPGKEYFEVQNKKNGGRMLNYFWNEDAWSKVTLADHPTYKFTMDLNMSSMATRGDMEFTLLPVGACESSDQRVSTHNYHWWNSTETEDFFFRWRVGTAPTAANGEYTIWVNEEPTARNDWASDPGEANHVTLQSQTTYKFACVINSTAKTATWTISTEDGTQIATGSRTYKCEENRAGIFIFGMNGTSTHQFSNIGLSYEAEGPFATEPSVDLLSARLTNRDYYATFAEGEVLHWVQVGDAEDALNGEQYADGQEYQVYYNSANDKRTYETDAENYFGSKIIYCTKSGTLKVWTTRDDDETNASDEVVNEVTCESIAMPAPTATITNVSEGYGKEYTITADNSSTLLTPTVTIAYSLKDASGTEVKSGTLSTGEKITFDAAGSLELYSYDGTHTTPWYTQSGTVTINNNVEYEKYSFTDYAWTKDKCDGTVEGFSKLEIVDNANKSHWDRIYSTQKYGYDATGNASAYVDGTDYAYVKEGFGFYEGTAIGTDDAKWNVQVPENIYSGFSPLIPAENANYTADAWAVFPLEGVVYYATNITNVPVGIDSCYVSDDAAKPNFYIVHTRGGYDRPDKGDCNATTVCVAGENYSLYRYDTAICDVTIMVYKGFKPGTSGISAAKTTETAAPAVKKVVTKDGVRIIKGDNVYSISGAQVK